MQIQKKDLAKKIFDVSYLKGNFTLRSGQKSNEYFDKYQFESHPKLLESICQHFIDLIPKDTCILGGLELGGVPLATILSLKKNIPMVFIRKKAKEYGTCKLAEGIDIKNKKICLIEDVITTGGQVIESTLLLRKLGAQVDHVICVIQRGDNLNKILETKLTLHSLFTLDQLKTFQKNNQ